MTEPARAEQRFDRDLAEVTTVTIDAAQTTSQDTTRYVNNFYKRLAQADRREEERAFEIRVFGEPLPPTTRDFLFGPEESK